MQREGSALKAKGKKKRKKKEISIITRDAARTIATPSSLLLYKHS
jgi:hypothetical protein